MRILVTGGSGLVGRYVVDELATSEAVEILDLQPAHRDDIRRHGVDILDLPSVQGIMHEYDAVVHLAGIPHPLNDPPEVVFRTNTLGTFNLLQASVTSGIKRFVFMSSESTLGFAFATTKLIPAYLPVDEAHPLRPQDPYGLSKVACEQLCRGFSDRSGMTTLCLRAPWIWVPEEKERAFYRQLIDEYPQWYKNLWAFIHVRDVAHAIKLALTAKLPVHDTAFIAAEENWTGRESRELVSRFYPETPSIKPALVGSASLISSRKATTLLGFHPHRTVADIFA